MYDGVFHFYMYCFLFVLYKHSYLRLCGPGSTNPIIDKCSLPGGYGSGVEPGGTGFRSAPRFCCGAFAMLNAPTLTL